MNRVLAVVVVFAIAIAAVPVYIVLALPSSFSPCGSTSQGSPPLVGILGSPPFGFEYLNTTRVGGTYWYNFSLVPWPPNLTAGQLTFRATLSNGSAASGVEEFQLWNHSGQVIAIANGSTSAWTKGSSAIVQFTDTLTVVSVVSLAGDNLVGMVPLQCGQVGTGITPFG
jgi:hypothetical protein